MPFDGLVINSIASELKEILLTKKIEKIYQPENDEILIKFRNVSNKLLVSVNSSFPHISLTDVQKKNPLNPPMFCMLLRKHLHGGKIVDIHQVDFERILVISIESYDELGNISIKKLIIEIMGKHSNIILIEGSSSNVIDSIKRIPSNISRQRQLLPGLKYEYPPSQDKVNVFAIDYEDFVSKLNSVSSDTKVFKALYKSFQGISPVIAKEICFNANFDLDRSITNLSQEDFKDIWNVLRGISDKINEREYLPNIIFDKKDNKTIDFSSLELSMYKNELFSQMSFVSMSKAINKFYLEKDKHNRIKQKSTDIVKIINTRLERLYNKLQKQREELLTAEGADKYKLYGELILSNMHNIQRGIKEVTLQNYYEDTMPQITIPLDSRLTPSENSQKYYKRYNKYKSAQNKISTQIKETCGEIQYLENVMINIENTDDINNIEEIKQELIEQKYIRKRKIGKQKEKALKSKPYKYITENGFIILAGKNNKQNDQLTLKTASKKDIWFHTKDIPGSHVIIKTDGKPVPEDTIMTAALIAAHHSKGRQSSNVPVDYTHVKFVKKPSGAKPGMVIYENFKTIYVTPYENEIKKLEAQS
jgi:predicted ribosome quality control (RQC) complex YloA/Tae2 family protein